MLSYISVHGAGRVLVLGIPSPFATCNMFAFMNVGKSVSCSRNIHSAGFILSLIDEVFESVLTTTKLERMISARTVFFHATFYDSVDWLLFLGRSGATGFSIVELTRRRRGILVWWLLDSLRGWGGGRGKWLFCALSACLGKMLVEIQQVGGNVVIHLSSATTPRRKMVLFSLPDVEFAFHGSVLEQATKGQKIHKNT